MSKLLRYFAIVIATAWVGGLWVTGFSANTIFKIVEDRRLAGDVAGTLFTFMSSVGIISALCLISYFIITLGKQALKNYLFWIVLLMLVLVLGGQFGVQPWLASLRELALPIPVMQSEYANQFAIGHGIAGVIYIIECLLGLLLVCQIADFK